MARGSTLVRVRKMVKAEIGASLTVSNIADDTCLNQLIENKQNWFVGEYDWPFLRDVPVNVTCASGTRYFTLPADIIYERPVRVVVQYTSSYLDLAKGIGAGEYNIHDPTEFMDPIQRWRITDDGQFEVWPVPNTTQVVTFFGQRNPATLLAAGVFDDTKVVELDDLLIALSVAAERLADLKKPSAGAKQALADRRLRSLRSAAPQRDSRMVLGWYDPTSDEYPVDDEGRRRVVPLTVA